MIKIKFCGLTSEEDIVCVNACLPDYIGFVFAPQSRRYISPDKARLLRKNLDGRIMPVGVFVNETAERVAALLNSGTIGMAQLHGNEDTKYIRHLRTLTDKSLIQAFKVAGGADVEAAQNSEADFVLLDASRAGSGETFDWTLIGRIDRPFFLAGGLNARNAADAAGKLNPYALDVSSGIESCGHKDIDKMRAFLRAVRKYRGEMI